MAKDHRERIRFAHDEILVQGNLGAVDEVFAADYVLHAGGKNHRGAKFVKRFIGQLRSGLPDLRVVKIEFLMEAGATVAWQRTLRGTHELDMMGIPASGKKVEWRDLLVTRFDQGKIAEDWAVSELAEHLLLKQPRA